MEGACFGSSLRSIVIAEVASVLLSAQSIPNTADRTVSACRAVPGIVRPRSARDSR